MANVVKRVSNLLDFQPPPQVGMDQIPPTENFNKTTPLSAFGYVAIVHFIPVQTFMVSLVFNC